MSWLRRNRLALISLAVLVPASVGVALSAGHSEQVIPRPTARTAVDSGASGEYGGATFRVTDAVVLDDTAPQLVDADVTLPTGTQLVVVTAEVDVGAVDETAGAEAGAASIEATAERIQNCDVTLVGTETATLAGASWDAGAAGRLGLLRDGDNPRDSCDLSDPGPQTIQWTFLTPVQPVDDLALRVTSYVALPKYLWMPVAPATQ